MNYIKSLEATVTVKDQEIIAINRGLNDLASYLTSDKFSTDPTVQVSDVLRYITEIRQAASDAAYA
jgi:hypothetical protein